MPGIETCNRPGNPNLLEPDLTLGSGRIDANYFGYASSFGQDDFKCFGFGLDLDSFRSTFTKQNFFNIKRLYFLILIGVKMFLVRYVCNYINT